MTTKNQKPNLRSRIQSAGFLIWVISGFYLLAMTWFLLSAMSAHGSNDMQPWLSSLAAAATGAYGILMLLLWQNDERRGNQVSR
jgi:succinate dehydrogenase hydrophobic anchor subunit